MFRPVALVLVCGVLAGVPVPAAAQRPVEDAADFAGFLATGAQVTPNVTYLTANGVELKLDIYRPRGTAPRPTALLFHGGGYRAESTKEAFALNVIPWLQMGWNAINVEYRSSGHSLAPGAVEDARCALKWVSRNAKEYNVDPNRIVITGQSAGGHLALVAGMIPESAGLDYRCNATNLKVAAIVSWYGVWDYTTLVDDPARDYARTWVAPNPNRMEVAKLISPLTYMRPGLPPVFAIHGDADPIVPYEQAVRGTAALKGAGVPYEFFTVPGGRHGNFPREHVMKAWQGIAAFLNTHVPAPANQTAAR
jgi:acetyl esterase/lipase